MARSTLTIPVSFEEQPAAQPAAQPEEHPDDSFLRRIRGKLAHGISVVNTHAKPVLAAASRIEEFSRLQSPLGVLGAVSRTVTDLEEWAKDNKPMVVRRRYAYHPGVVWNTLLVEFARIGTERSSDEEATVTIDGCQIRIREGSGDKWSLEFDDTKFPDMVSRLNEIADRLVPRSIRCECASRDCPITESSEPGMESPRAHEILSRVQRMLERVPSRVILLHGPPGTGKSQMARWIANRVARVRIAHLSFDVLQDGCNYLNVPTDVVVIDDVDKTHINLYILEKLRESSRLVILTANNAMDDHVIDGAVIRCGRIDETYEIKDIGIALQPEPPFDALDEETFERIRRWPAAAMAEVKARIECYGIDPEDLRLDEIEQRVEMKCRSVKVVSKSSELPQPL